MKNPSSNGYPSFFSLLLVILLSWLTHPLLGTPLFQVELSSNTPHQGDTLFLTLRTDHWIPSPTLRWGKQTLFTFRTPKNKKDPYVYVAYIGIAADCPTGNQVLDVIIGTDHAPSQTVQSIPFTVESTAFDFTELTFSEDKKSVVSNVPQLQNEAESLEKKFKQVTTIAYFHSPFAMPTEGKITSTFGSYRVYNKVRSAIHSGLDIANEPGTPVLAANRGKVIFSQTLKSHGNTILIDHGFGVISVYLHLRKRLVNEGSIVNQGQPIGEMGMTGIATGPHLHWGMSVQNVRVNPEFWIKHENLHP